MPLVVKQNEALNSLRCCLTDLYLSAIEFENMRKDSAYPPSAGYYAERFCLSSEFGVLYRIILPIHPLQDIRRKVSVY